MKFDRDPYLERVYLTGQVSNFRRRPSHQYFSLKDEGAVIQATIGAGVFKKLGYVTATDTVNTPETLDDACGIPMNVIIDEVVAIL